MQPTACLPGGSVLGPGPHRAHSFGQPGPLNLASLAELDIEPSAEDGLRGLGGSFG